MRTRYTSLIALSSLLGAACVGAEPEALDTTDSPTASDPSASSPRPPVGRSVAEIRAEQPNGAAEIVSRRYLDGDVALASYATAYVGAQGSCSGTMIGPNVLMTAAHCGPNRNTSAVFRVYRNRSTTVSDAETFTCRYLYQTWHSSDLVLYYCDPNAAGVNPGDKYGYLDFERAAPAVGTALYSVWWNPLDSTGVSDVRFYSEGRVTSTTDYGTFTTDPARVLVSPVTGLPDYATSVQRPIAVATDLWSNGGASGSAQLSRATHRIVVGPLSTGQGDTRGRYALSIHQYLADGTVNYRDPEVINADELRRLGLRPSAYAGLVDKNRDRVFDVQADLEWARGEARRDHYFLGFDSERRNLLWESNWMTAIDAPSRTARINVPTTVSSPTRALWHPRLNLKSNTSYRVSMTVFTTRANLANGLSVQFVGREQAGARAERVASSRDLVTTAGTSGQIQSFVLTTGAEPDPELRFVARAGLDVQLLAPSVVEVGSVMDFDSADKRANWRNDNNGARAVILPDGRATGQPNWAALVTRNASFARGNDWPLRNRQLAIPDGRYVRVCADVLQSSPSAPAHAWGVMRVLSPSGEVIRAAFTPNTAWAQPCTGWFWSTSGDNNLQFGTDADIALAPAYLVDNVRVEVW